MLPPAGLYGPGASAGVGGEFGFGLPGAGVRRDCILEEDDSLEVLAHEQRKLREEAQGLVMTQYGVLSKLSKKKSIIAEQTTQIGALRDAIARLTAAFPELAELEDKSANHNKNNAKDSSCSGSSLKGSSSSVSQLNVSAF